jgi:hypothetical protein
MTLTSSSPVRAASPAGGAAPSTTTPVEGHGGTARVRRPAPTTSTSTPDVQGPAAVAGPDFDSTPHTGGGRAAARSLTDAVLVLPLTSQEGRRYVVALGEPADWSSLRLMTRVVGLAAATWGAR